MTQELVAKLGIELSSDPRWLVLETGYNPVREHEVETLLTIGNGYLGTRGSLEESSQVGKPATLIAGFFDPNEGGPDIPALVIVPNWLHAVISIDGKPVRIDNVELLEQRRWLDLRRAVMVREWRWRDTLGRITSVAILRCALLMSPHILLMRLAIKPENYSARLQVTAGLDGRTVSRGRRASEGAARLDELDARPLDQGGLLLEMITHSSRLRCAMASQLVIAPTSATLQPQQRAEWCSNYVAEQIDFDALLGESYIFDKFVTVYTDRDLTAPASAAIAELKEAQQRGFTSLLIEHDRHWQERWQRADVVIESDDQAEEALRFCLYHLLIAANAEDEHVSIGARTLSGPSYNGHVFWDTEVFMLPFFIYLFPAAARAMLMYRYHTLAGARAKAAQYGYRGALYAWESAVTGAETTPPFVLSPEGKELPVYSGLQQHHISADVAYAIWQYWQASNDEALMLQAGAEILLEIARFWASRAEPDAVGRYHINNIMGPDEYHNSVDDNAFTNYIAHWTIERGEEILTWLRTHHHRRAEELITKLAISKAELQNWQAVAAGLVTGYHSDKQLYEQFDGFFSLTPIDLKQYEPRVEPMDVLLGQELINRTQVIKQPDVVMLLHLFPYAFQHEIKVVNFNYYDPLCGHGSSLSPAICATMAAHIGLAERAAYYFHKAASIDLENNMGNAAGGIHAAACGGLWQAVIYGFAGFMPMADHLAFNPRLLPGWQRLKFKLLWRGSLLEVEINNQQIIFQVQEGEQSLAVALAGGAIHTLKVGQQLELLLPAQAQAELLDTQAKLTLMHSLEH
ncbi:MAG: glycosyl hydrolase family 65 protein [Acidobacteriota bacterium]